jgi:hypothetical protein
MAFFFLQDPKGPSNSPYKNYYKNIRFFLIIYFLIYILRVPGGHCYGSLEATAW